MTAAQWLDFWYQTYKKPNLRPNTQMSYERRIYQHIIPNLGPIPLNKLTTGDIQQFYTWVVAAKILFVRQSNF